MPKLWMVRANYGAETQRCVDGGFHGIGWRLGGDLAGVTERAEIAQRWERVAPEEDGPATRHSTIGNISRFVLDISVGDWILTPETTARWLRYGKVTSGYYYDPEAAETDGCPYPHRRSVEWEEDKLDRRLFSVPFQNTLMSPLTVFDAKHVSEFLTLIGKHDPTVSPSGDETKQASPTAVALQHILMLTATDFEQLVGHLLAAMGFEIEVTQPTNDGGVDFRGVFTVSNAASIAVVGQVKRFKLGSKISAKDVLDLRGRIPVSAQGTFVTTADFAKKAREEADAEGFQRVGLINGQQLIDLLTLHWEAIPEDFREQLQLKPGLVPA